MPSPANRHSACTILAAGLIAAATGTAKAGEKVEPPAPAQQEEQEAVASRLGPVAGLRGEALTAQCRAWGAVSGISDTTSSRWKGARDTGQRANLLAEVDGETPADRAASPSRVERGQ